MGRSWRWFIPIAASFLSGCLGDEHENSFNPCAEPVVHRPEDIESLQACSSIGVLSIGGDLKTLHGLEHISQVKVLRVSSWCSLESLSGLSGLRVVTGSVEIQCETLGSLEGLGEVDVGGSVLVKGTRIKDLRGLEKVVFQHFTLQDNEFLASLDGLGPRLRSREVEVSIRGAPQLSSLQGLKFESVASLDVSDTGVLSLRGADSLTRVTAHLSLSGNHNLTSVDGLDSVVSIGALRISDNEELVELSGLATLGTLEELFIAENPKLATLGPLLNLSPGSVSRVLVVRKNPSLSQCEVDRLFETQFPGSVSTCTTSCESNDDRPCEDLEPWP